MILFVTDNVFVVSACETHVAYYTLISKYCCFCLPLFLAIFVALGKIAAKTQSSVKDLGLIL